MRAPHPSKPWIRRSCSVKIPQSHLFRAQLKTMVNQVPASFRLKGKENLPEHLETEQLPLWVTEVLDFGQDKTEVLISINIWALEG